MDLLTRAKNIEPTIRIGKKGLTDQQLNEIEKQLNKRKLVKIKLLRSFLEDKDKKKVFKEIAEKTNSKLVYSAGFVAAFHKNS